jgi:hypothetical protein
LARKRPALTTWLLGNHTLVSTAWRSIHYADGTEETYTAKDPWNHTNLAAKPEHAAVISEMKERLPQAAKLNPRPRQKP